jgi:hypothetical protein
MDRRKEETTMTTPFGVAGELILSIAGSFAALALAAALAQRFLISAAWRRAIWQACILGMMLFAVLELAGARASWALWHSAGRPAARPSRATASDRPAQTAALAPKVANPELRRGPEEEQRPLAESAPNSESARLAPPALVVPNSARGEIWPMDTRAGSVDGASLGGGLCVGPGLDWPQPRIISQSASGFRSGAGSETLRASGAGAGYPWFTGDIACADVAAIPWTDRFWDFTSRGGTAVRVRGGNGDAAGRDVAA